MAISLCMVVKDEEYFLRDALDSVKDIVDEMIICVDDRSTDKTEEIAREYTDKVFLFKWKHNFSTARNFSLTKATKEWILVLDADETIAQEDHEIIKKATEKKDVVGFTLKQVSYTDDTHMFGFTPVEKKNKHARGFLGHIPCTIVRLFQNKKEIQFEGAVHESVDISVKKIGTIEELPINIHHYQFAKGDANQKEKQLAYLKIYEKNIKTYTDKARAYRDMGTICLTFKKDYVRAEKYFTKSLKLRKDHPKTYVGLALAQANQEKWQDMLKTIQQGLLQSPGDKHLQYLQNIAKRNAGDQKV